MAKIGFIFPCQMFLIGVDDEREGEMRHIVAVATHPEKPEEFTRALLVSSAKAVDMQSGNASIKALTPGVERELLNRIQKALRPGAPQAAETGGPANPSSETRPNEAQDMLAEALKGGKKE